MYFLLSCNHYVLQDSCDTLGDTGSLKLSAKNHYINEMVRKQLQFLTDEKLTHLPTHSDNSLLFTSVKTCLRR